MRDNPKEVDTGEFLVWTLALPSQILTKYYFSLKDIFPFGMLFSFAAYMFPIWTLNVFYKTETGSTAAVNVPPFLFLTFVTLLCLYHYYRAWQRRDAKISSLDNHPPSSLLERFVPEKHHETLLRWGDPMLAMVGGLLIASRFNFWIGTILIISGIAQLAYIRMTLFRDEWKIALIKARQEIHQAKAEEMRKQAMGRAPDLNYKKRPEQAARVAGSSGPSVTPKPSPAPKPAEQLLPTGQPVKTSFQLEKERRAQLKAAAAQAEKTET